MLALPPLFCAPDQNNAAATPSNTAPGTTVTGAGTSHVKGSWTQLIAALDDDCIELSLTVFSTATAGVQTDALLDLGIGAGGSESVLVANIPAGWRQSGISAPGPQELILPLAIPKGTRLAARAQGLELSKAVNVLVSARIGPSQPSPGSFQGVDTIGAVTASSQGTSHTAGNTGAFSSWTNFGAAIARAYRALLLVPQGSMADTAMNNAAYRFEVGFSSAALGAWTFFTSTNEATGSLLPGRPILCPVPAGTQLQIRGTCSATAEALDFVILGFY